MSLKSHFYKHQLRDTFLKQLASFGVQCILGICNRPTFLKFCSELQQLHQRDFFTGDGDLFCWCLWTNLNFIITKIRPKSFSQYSNPFQADILYIRLKCFNRLNANFTKWSNTLKQFFENLPTNCLSVIDHFVGLVLKGLIISFYKDILVSFNFFKELAGGVENNFV